MLRIEIEAASGDELRAKLVDLAQVFGGAVDPRQLTLPLDNNGEETTTARGRRGRKPNEEKVAAAQTPPAPAPAAPPEIDPFSEPPAATPAPAAITFDQVKQALKDVNDKKGLPAAKKILEEFNCVRISEVRENTYPQFVKACQNALAA